MAMKKCYEWMVCSLCSGDGVANMPPDENGEIEEGECPKCGGTGYERRTFYIEIDEDWLKETMTEAISTHPDWFEARVVKAFIDNKDDIRDAFKQWMRDVLDE